MSKRNELPGRLRVSEDPKFHSRHNHSGDSRSPRNVINERISVDVSRVSVNQLNIQHISFLKCELQIDISTILSPSVVGMYFFSVQFENTQRVIQKRYSQFYFLDNYIHSKYNRLKLPTLPPKEILHSGSHPDVIHKRSKDLSIYLEQVIRRQELLTDNIVIDWFTDKQDINLVSFSKQRKAGYVEKEGNFFKSWKRRYCVLAPKVIALFENAKDLIVYADPIDVYCLKDCVVRPAVDKGVNIMTISRNNSTLCCLRVEKDEDFLRWLNAIQEIIMTDKKNDRKTLPDHKLERFKKSISPRSTKILNEQPKRVEIETDKIPQSLSSSETGSIQNSLLNSHRSSSDYETELFDQYEGMFRKIYETYKTEMSVFKDNLLNDCKEIDQEDFEFFKRLRSLPFEVFKDVDEIDDLYEQLIERTKKYSECTIIQKLTWVFINIYKLYQVYCSHKSINNQLNDIESIESIGLEENIDQSKQLVCKICDHPYKLSQFCEHIRLCEVIAKENIKQTTCQHRMVMVVKKLIESNKCGLIKDTFKYTQLVEVIQCFDSLTSILQLEKMIDAIKMLCVDMNDVVLLTFARTTNDLLLNYLKLLTDFSTTKANKNLWGYISVLSSSSSKQAISQYQNNSVSLSDFHIIKKFSAGAYSRIYLVQKKSTGDIYAMKVMKKDDMVRKNVVESVLVEKNFLSKAHNISVVKLYYAFQDETNLYLVMEYCPGGDLATLLENVGCLNEYVAKVYSAEILISLHYIHALGCVHKDIKPDNILINKNGHLVLTDFGLSQYGMVSHENVKKSGLFCTPDYAAPEILISNSYSFASDYFALGCMLYEFVVGNPPFNANTPEAIFTKIQQGIYEWPEDCEVSDECKDLIHQLLCPDPNQRPQFEQIEQHPFYSDIQWKTLFEESREDIFVPQLENNIDTGYFEDQRDMKITHMGKDDFIDSGLMSPIKMPQTSKLKKKKDDSNKLRKASPLPDEFHNFDVKNIEILIEENKHLYQRELMSLRRNNVKENVNHVDTVIDYDEEIEDENNMDDIDED